jgi:hypothetical protein
MKHSKSRIYSPYSWSTPDVSPRVEQVGVNGKTAYIVVNYRGKTFCGRVTKKLAKELLKED